MQISKFSLCFCALALCTGFTALAEDTPAQAAARAALEAKMQQLQGGTVAAPQTPAPAEPAPVTAAAAPATTAPAATTTAPVQAPVTSDSVTVPQTTTQPGDTEAQAAARAAMEAKMSQLGSPVTPAPVMAAQGKNPTARSAALMGKPIVAPPLPISMTKEQKLAALLGQYEANQISPVQYHEQRAAILAEQQ